MRHRLGGQTMPTVMVALAIVSCVGSLPSARAQKERPSAAALIERFTREKSPAWADGETATFFFRGDALKVEVIAGGDFKALERIGTSDVWSVTFKLPEVERAVISY